MPHIEHVEVLGMAAAVSWQFTVADGSRWVDRALLLEEGTTWSIIALAFESVNRSSRTSLTVRCRA
jgi:hypothetical protein